MDSATGCSNSWYTRGMEDGTSDASTPDATQATQDKVPHATQATHPAQDLELTLTVAEARQRFAALDRHVPAERTVQNYCVQGDIAAQKIRTTYGSEWIINAPSLDGFIERQPEAPLATQAPQGPPSLAPHATHALADKAPQSAAAGGEATPIAAGESRSIGTVLLENARVLERLEGRDQLLIERDRIIAELRDDRSFLRDELKEARKTQGDVKTIAQRMLETLETMALGGRILRAGQAVRADRDFADGPAPRPREDGSDPADTHR